MGAPGFHAGEPLPAGLPAVLATLRRALTSTAAVERPFALAGYSSGGWLAHSLAGYLETHGPAPAAVVLLDTYLPMSEVDERRARFMREQLRRLGLASPESRSAGLGDQISAMGGYVDLFASWRPARLTAPTLLVRASESLSGLPAGRAEDQFPPELCTVVNVPGHHFSLISRHTETTARAVHDWLSELR
jgi:acetyl esterase/lipase